jgi:hypothetical protein
MDEGKSMKDTNDANLSATLTGRRSEVVFDEESHPIW